LSFGSSILNSYFAKKNGWRIGLVIRTWSTRGKLPGGYELMTSACRQHTWFAASLHCVGSARSSKRIGGLRQAMTVGGNLANPNKTTL